MSSSTPAQEPDPAPDPSPPPAGPDRRPWPLLLVGLALVGILAVAVLTSQDEAPTMEEPGDAATAPGESEVTDEMRQVGDALARRDGDDPFALGDVDAPVVMIVWSDYHCPYCGQWVRETQPELVEDYVRSGDLRIEWREFPALGDGSAVLARAGYAAGEQDRFWEFHETYFAEDRQQLTGDDLDEEIAEVADTAGIDVEQLRTDMDTTAAEDHVEHDAQQGQGIGVSATPAFLVNGEMIMGAQPTPVFMEAIERALDEAEDTP
ncbi:thioredoxin domain-containing protein [Lipingzhangella sp. LS1_29]|uniref:Thioredoxin domain-containing protein n=1 Tax=Lipingzhangella rawalii TaxID=2055835 RepID=A0ABU2H4V0_9ACTN|nr:thioredoxin domain-containing protein [Lipingzhangella rawalii]MDS1270323.1 thioredoxin domain-containing protein [Lipingzhangella rawalii]